jgi:uncharacterized protein YuzE
MKKPKIFYFEEKDILHVVIAERTETSSVEVTPDITVELNMQGELIGIEILNAGRFVRDALLEGV